MSGALDNGEHKDGGRAFPCDQIIERNANGNLHGREVASGGMTLRDYFAAKAMQVYLPIIHQNHASAGCDQGMDAIADAAYGLADAMLKARKP